MVMRVLSWADLHQTSLAWPSTLDHHPMKMAEGLSRVSVTMATHDLLRDRHSCCPVGL
jgi:hypothetical protein